MVPRAADELNTYLRTVEDPGKTNERNTDTSSAKVMMIFARDGVSDLDGSGR